MDLKSEKNILQILKDADCSDEFMEEFLKLREQGDKRILMQLLYKHKSGLLDCLHASQKKNRLP